MRCPWFLSPRFVTSRVFDKLVGAELAVLTKGTEIPCLRPAVVSLLRLTKVYVPYRFDGVYSLLLFSVAIPYR